LCKRFGSVPDPVWLAGRRQAGAVVATATPTRPVLARGADLRDIVTIDHCCRSISPHRKESPVIINSGRAQTRPTVVLLAAALAVAGVLTVVARTTPAFAATVEDEGADCAVTLPGSLTASSRLPDPFRRINGTRITSVSDWRCRRAEIRELAERYVYGDKPARPQTVTGTVSNTGITVNVSHNGRSASFSAGVTLPSGAGPFPAVVVLGGFGADTATIRAAGAATINYDPLAVGREGTPRNNKQGAFYSIYGNTSSTGLLAAWAWGVSRIIDVLEQSGGTILRADATGVTGCSRYGKGAFVVGAFDQRIALTMPIESGSAGAPIFRGIPGESGAQPLSSAYGEQPWLGDAFNSFTGDPNNLPVDTHSTIGMIAPRGLFIMENPHIDWLAARSGSVAALAGAEIYRALGTTSNISYWSDIADGTHCAARNEWRTPLQQSIQRFLRNTGSASGQIRISSRKAGNLAEWRDWTTPTLTNSTTTTTTTTTSRPPTTTMTTTTSTSQPPTTTTMATNPPGGCSATFRTIGNPWPGGYQGEFAVTNTGAATTNGWTVRFTLVSGQTLGQLWGGRPTPIGSTVTVANEAWNGRLAPSAGTVFGVVVNGSSTTPPSAVTCTTS
jgi:hypothetical protein